MSSLHEISATSAFSTDQVFNSREELMTWVQNVAYSFGYVIVTKRSKINQRGEVYMVILICDRGGEYKVKGTSKDSGSKKINCPFELRGKYSTIYCFWTLTVICDEHNHPPAQHMEGHPYARRLSDKEIAVVTDLTRKNVAPRDILSIIKEQDENNVSTLKTIYNARQRIRMTEQKGRTPMQALISLLHTNGYVFEFSTNDFSNELESLFFVHPTSLEIWRAFPHVLLIDATYKTNKYNMPFLEIVGVTSTNKTFCIAFVFMHKEKEANYTWALNCLKLTLDECMHPRVIVTDKELALINACRQVFPDATQLLCRWHITQNISKNCKPTFKSQHDWDSFLFKWKLLIESPTQMSYMDNYQQLQSMLTNYPGVLNYLDQVWLNKHKDMFVSAWIDQHLNFGNRTTNRVESQHALLKKHLNSSNSSLDKFVAYIDQIVKAQITSIKESFEKSQIVRKHQHNIPCLRLLRGFVAIQALDIIVGEFERSNGLQLSSSNCGCQLRNSCGLPCACVLAMYVNSGQCIPLDSIDIFWRKLDFLPSTFVQNENISCDKEIELFRESFKKQSNSGKRSFLRKLREIFDPSTTFVEEPAVQQNTRGRPSLKKQQQKKRADQKCEDPPRCSSYMEPVRCSSYIEPARHSSYVEPSRPSTHMEPASHSTRKSSFVGLDFIDLNEELAEHSSDMNFQTSYSHRLMAQIPNIFHPYITRIKNVKGDGNCGFRSVAVCLGHGEDQWANIKHQLLDELCNAYHTYARIIPDDLIEVYQTLCSAESPAPNEHWMSMPYTGILIANRFGVIVHSLSIEGCMTCFPFWRGPEEFEQHQTLTVAHVNRNHYVMVQLQGEYPMPPITPFWKFHKLPRADGWETMYASRLELYTQLLHSGNCEKVLIDLND